MGEVKVIGSTKSLFCTRIEWALKLKGVEYEYLNEDLKNKSPTLLKYNPVHKKVPVLLHDGKSIAESLVILEYIDEVWTQNPLLPQDPYQRTISRFWAKFSDEKVLLGSFGACKAQGEEKQKAVESAHESQAFLEKEIEGKKYSGGESIGYLDLTIGWIPLWISVMEEVDEMKLIETEKFPFLHKWSQNFMETPLIRECLPSGEALLEHFHTTISFLRSLEANKQ
ncbi:hypothetical protein TIFTF001_015495 [Ficus carica]|uniref:glutathione transferase n=1 Tax=Ficus carica TaxID=3494 RepID=A0AA88ALM1_FICCA|nr:hypothetical protein TIFTF001_015495 [Ficus carica]